MASVYDLKPAFQRVLRPIVRALAGAGVTANHVTVAAAVLSIGVGALIALWPTARWPLLLLGPWLFARMALNAIEGMIARERSLATPLGAVLNEVGDVVSDLALYLPLALVHEPSRWPVILFVLGALLTEFCGVLGQALGGVRRYEGPMGKSDRALLGGALGLATFITPATFALWPWVFGIAALLCVATCWNRLARTLRAQRSASQG